jgi:hypothetical protein
MAKGLSFESFAGRIGVSRRVLYDWLDAHEEFLHAKEIGAEKSLLRWEMAGIRGYFAEKIRDDEALSGFRTDKQELIPAVWIFNMKNRFGWRDRQKDEVDVVVNNLSSLTDAELDQKIQQLESKLNQGKKNAA